MGKRVQPITFASTTAGNNPQGLAAEEHAFSLRVRDRPELDPSRLVLIRNTPTEADPWSERSWLRANPALGTPPTYRDGYLSIATLRSEAKEAQENPARENAFRQYRLDQWVQQGTRFVALSSGRAGGRGVRRRGARRGGVLGRARPRRRLGYDRVGAGVPARRRAGRGRRPLPLWVPSAQIEEDPSGDIARLARAGWVNVTEGNVTDYRVVRQALVEDAERFRIDSLALDYAFQGIQLAQELVEEGLDVTRFRSGFRAFAEPMVQFERRVVEAKLRHGANPVLRWQVDNLAVVRNALGHQAPAKDRSGGKIDGIVATIMAIGEMTAEGSRRRSAYEDRGLELA